MYVITIKVCCSLDVVMELELELELKSKSKLKLTCWQLHLPA